MCFIFGNKRAITKDVEKSQQMFLISLKIPLALIAIEGIIYFFLLYLRARVMNPQRRGGSRDTRSAFPTVEVRSARSRPARRGACACRCCPHVTDHEVHGTTVIGTGDDVGRERSAPHSTSDEAILQRLGRIEARLKDVCDWIAEQRQQTRVLTRQDASAALQKTYQNPI
ncbi:ORF4 [Blacklegged tick chuvirus 2]|uniref:ORF4 n=1 Tax=Blacklegged tick chuvirus 2 TaxID=2079604 RepID=A0A2K9YNG7_9VIRU|nr:ORF4 [Blacklegged tick chuvirus-2]AUW34385.1 ORF4 [Blacklegged tick chuvirus-2]